MINFEKMDDIDFVFINQVLSNKDEKDFSDFLKKRRTKNSRSVFKSKPKETQK